MEYRFKFRVYTGYDMAEFDLFCNPYDKYKMQKEEMPIMQCTGLRDKNDKLIYEGDITKYYYNSHGLKPVNRVITFHNGVFLSGGGLLHNCLNCEIIGNVHENKDLLNDN